MEEEGRVARHSLGKTFVRHSQIAGNSLAWLQQCHRQCNHFLLLGFMQRIRLWLLILTTTATQRTATPHCPSRMPCHASPRPAAMVDCGSNFDFSADAKFAASHSLCACALPLCFPLCCSVSPPLSLHYSLSLSLLFVLFALLNYTLNIFLPAH